MTIRTSLRFALAASTVAVAVLVPSTPAMAHPLGNFTINVYAGVIVQPEAIVVDYVVDMAEIPAFRERRSIDTDLDDTIDEQESSRYGSSMCASLAEGLRVRTDDTHVTVTAAGVHALSFPQGAGGLSTMRLECRLAGAAAITPHTVISVVDRNFPGSIGWHEITAVGDGVTVSSSDVPDVSATARLTAYPATELAPDVRRASFAATPGGPRLAALPEPGAGPAGSFAPIGGRDGGLLASLVGRDELTATLVAAMLVVAFGVGALHALGPGHGKTLIGAYLVGAGGTVRHAVGVGAAISVMHTASVLALGLVVLSAERVLAPERVYPVLGLASGLVALALGSVLLVSRIHPMLTHDHQHPHDHPHPHRHPHPHTRAEEGQTDGAPGHSSIAPSSPLSRRGLLALAFSGGILPSPSALVVLLASVSLGRTALGLVLIAAFSVGLALALVGVGVLTLRARDFAEQRLTQRAARLLPVASAGAIAVMGIFLTVRGAMQL